MVDPSRNFLVITALTGLMHAQGDLIFLLTWICEELETLEDVLRKVPE